MKDIIDYEHESGNESWEEVSCNECNYESKGFGSDSENSWCKLNKYAERNKNEGECVFKTMNRDLGKEEELKRILKFNKSNKEDVIETRTRQSTK